MGPWRTVAHRGQSSLIVQAQFRWSSSADMRETSLATATTRDSGLHRGVDGPVLGLHRGVDGPADHYFDDSHECATHAEGDERSV